MELLEKALFRRTTTALACGNYNQCDPCASSSSSSSSSSYGCSSSSSLEENWCFTSSSDDDCHSSSGSWSSSYSDSEACTTHSIDYDEQEANLVHIFNPNTPNMCYACGDLTEHLQASTGRLFCNDLCFDTFYDLSAARNKRRGGFKPRVEEKKAPAKRTTGIRKRSNSTSRRRRNFPTKKPVESKQPAAPSKSSRSRSQSLPRSRKPTIQKGAQSIKNRSRSRSRRKGGDTRSASSKPPAKKPNTTAEAASKGGNRGRSRSRSKDPPTKPRISKAERERRRGLVNEADKDFKEAKERRDAKKEGRSRSRSKDPSKKPKISEAEKERRRGLVNEADKDFKEAKKNRDAKKEDRARGRKKPKNPAEKEGASEPNTTKPEKTAEQQSNDAKLAKQKEKIRRAKQQARDARLRAEGAASASTGGGGGLFSGGGGGGGGNSTFSDAAGRANPGIIDGSISGALGGGGGFGGGGGGGFSGGGIPPPITGNGPTYLPPTQQGIPPPVLPTVQNTPTLSGSTAPIVPTISGSSGLPPSIAGSGAVTPSISGSGIPSAYNPPAIVNNASGMPSLYTPTSPGMPTVYNQPPPLITVPSVYAPVAVTSLPCQTCPLVVREPPPPRTGCNVCPYAASNTSLIPEDNLYYAMGIRGPNYWNQITPTGQPLAFGFGYGLWWATQFAWARRYFPFGRWFPVQRWDPFYVISEEDLLDYQFGGEIADDTILIDVDIFGNVPLPALPTFATIGIDLSGLVMLNRPVNQLRDRDKQKIRGVVRQIQNALDSLLANGFIKPYIDAGYWPVPDIDLQRFMWIKDALKSGAIQPARLLY